MGLQDKLNALREQSMSKIPKATATIMAGAITDELPVPATYVVDKSVCRMPVWLFLLLCNVFYKM